MAAEYIKLVGAAGTADEHDRIAGRLRQRAAVAAARTGSRGPDKAGVVARTDVQDHGDMVQTPYRRRITEECIHPPPTPR
jgi:hypothetical protein